MRRDYDRETVLASTLFSTMPPETAEQLMARSKEIELARGESIFLQGDPADRLFVVLDGWVKLFRVSSSGTEAVVGVFSKGESFAEAPAFQNTNYPVTAETVTACRLLQVKASEILTLMKDDPHVGMAMIGAVYAHLHALVAQIEQLVAQTGTQRVASFLLKLCKQSSGSCRVTLPYDKVIIARYLGITPESLSRAFGRLGREGVTIEQNHAIISDVARLGAFAGTEGKQRRSERDAG